MSHIIFDTIPDELPLTRSDDAPLGFKTLTDYGYDPATGSKISEPITEYWVSFLCPTTAIFSQVQQRLFSQRNAYFNDITEYIPCTITQDYNLGITNGTYNILYILDNEWYTRIGDTWQVNLRGYGTPPIASRITPGQVFSIPESATIGTIIGTVEGFDSTLLYVGRPDIPIGYDPTTGVLSVTEELDYEESDSYTLEIGGESIEVYILDESEAPLPVKTDYTFFIDSTAKTGTQVGTVEVDRVGDSGIKPTYSIVSGNNNSFAIDTVSGEITLLNIDNVTNNQVLGVSYGVGYVPLTVTIKIVSPDTEPKFDPYRFQLNPNPTTNQIVGAINEAGFTYTLNDPAYKMSGSNLVVVGPQFIEPGLTELEIEATNDKFQTGSIPVYIEVLEDLSASYGDQEFWIGEDSTNGTTVGTVDFNNDDPSLVYTLSPVGVFDINTRTGEILLVNSSLLSVSNYTLTATATGGYSKTIVVKVYAVVAESDVSYTVPDTTPIGQQVGVISGAYPLTLISGSLGNFNLDLSNGVITVGSTPISSVSFTVEDANTDSIAVQIEVSSADSGGSDNTVIGGVYPGQTGQSLLALNGIRFSVHEVAFGDGTCNVNPDNIGTISRNIGNIVIFDKPTVITHELSVSANVTTAMIAKLLDYLDSGIEVLCSVPTIDYNCVIVGLRQSYAEQTSVQLTLKETNSL